MISLQGRFWKLTSLFNPTMFNDFDLLIYTQNEKHKHTMSSYHFVINLLGLRLLFFVMYFLRNFSIAVLLNFCWLSALSIAVLVPSSVVATVASSILDSCVIAAARIKISLELCCGYCSPSLARFVWCSQHFFTPSSLYFCRRTARTRCLRLDRIPFAMRVDNQERRKG